MTRQAAAWALGARDDPEAHTVLAAALFDEQPDIREVAAWALRRSGEGPLSPDGVRLVPDLFVGQFRTADYLAELLRPPPTSGSAAAALTRAANPLRTALNRALGGGANPRGSTIFTALRALETTADGSVLLTPLVHSEELDDPTVREAMQPIERVVSERCVALLDHPNVSLRRLAITVLRGLAHEGAQDGLLRALSDEDQAVRFLALEGLGQHPSCRSTAAVMDLAGSDSWSVRTRVARTLGSFVCPAAQEA